MRLVNLFVETIAGAMLFAVVILMFTEVTFRTFFPDFILTWQEEVGRSLLVYISMLGGASALYHREHFAMPIVLRMFSTSRQRIALLISLVLMLGYGILWLVVSTRWVHGSANTFTAALQWDYRFIYAALPIGGLLFTLYSIHLTRRQWRDRRPMELGQVEGEGRE